MGIKNSIQEINFETKIIRTGLAEPMTYGCFEIKSSSPNGPLQIIERLRIGARKRTYVTVH